MDLTEKLRVILYGVKLMEDVDTVRLCEACGGEATADNCMWCTGGFQNGQQQAQWNLWRRRMKKVSGTYDFLRGTVEDVIGRLKDREDGLSVSLAVEGKRLLLEWEITDPLGKIRHKVTEELTEFVKKAMDHLTETDPPGPTHKL